jgi:AcrR family transcriptional regulator
LSNEKPSAAVRLQRTRVPAAAAEHSKMAPEQERERQPRRDRTREALVRAGQKLFSERPIEVVSVDDIVQVAEVAKGTFYNHFSDKEDFERAILEEARLEMETAIQTALGGDPDAAVRMAIAVCVAVRFAHDYPNRARLIARQGISGTGLQSEVNAAMISDISEGILSGRFTVPTVEIGALAVLGLGNIGIVRALEQPDIFAKVGLGQQLATMLLRALGLHGEEAYKIAARAAERIIRIPQAAAMP